MANEELRETVARLVEELLDEALRRDDFINKFVNVMKGALGEYLKARYAANNGFAHDAETAHWDKEVDEHFMFRFAQLVIVKTKGQFDVKKAFAEAMEDLTALTPNYLAWAKRKVAEVKSFKLDERTMVEVPDSDVDEFYARCWNEFETRRRR